MKRSTLLLTGLLLALHACQQADTSATPAGRKDRAGGQEIAAVTNEDIRQRLRFLSAEDRNFAQTAIGKQNLAQIVLREKLIRADALAQGLDKSADYQKLITEKRLQLDEIYRQYAQEMLENLWYEKHRQNGDLQVTQEEIDAYYKKYPYEMTVQQIIVDNAETADQVLRELKRSPSRWKELSRNYNIAPQTIQNAKFTFMPGEFLPDIEVIAANSSQGSVQGFIKTAFGFHIIMKTGEKRLSKQEATPRIEAVLENKKADKILENLQNKYEVMIYANEE